MNLPDEYHKSQQFTFRGVTEMLNGLEGTIKWSQNEKILDIGCGPGNITVSCLLPFLPKDATIVCCDMSKEMIAYANSNFKSDRVSFKEMDVESSEIWDAWAKSSFTKIFSFHLIHWLDNYRQTAENMFALLKPGGEMFHLYFPDHPIINVVMDLKNEEPWKKLIKGKSFFKWYSEKSLEGRNKAFFDELKRAGFEEIEMKMTDSEHWFSCCKECIVEDVDESMRKIPDRFISTTTTRVPYRRIETFKQVKNFLSSFNSNILRNIKFLMFKVNQKEDGLVKSVDPYRKYIPDHLLNEYDAAIEDKLKKTFYIDEKSGRARMDYKTMVTRAKKL